MGVAVQNVIGLTLTQAQTKLSGLTVKIVYATDSTKANGIVLAQSIKAGKQLVKGDEITLTVNKIEEPEPEEPTPPVTNTVTDPTTPITPEEPTTPVTNTTVTHNGSAKGKQNTN